jgi:hypothetical protein
MPMVPITTEEIQLSLKWIKGEITSRQFAFEISKKTGFKNFRGGGSSTVLYRVARSIKEAHRRGLITINYNK